MKSKGDVGGNGNDMSQLQGQVNDVGMENYNEEEIKK